jgi:hypothetical protein
MPSLSRSAEVAWHAKCSCMCYELWSDADTVVRHSRVHTVALEVSISKLIQGRQPPLLAAHDYGGADGDALRRDGRWFDTPPDDDAYSELSDTLQYPAH